MTRRFVTPPDLLPPTYGWQFWRKPSRPSWVGRRKMIGVLVAVALVGGLALGGCSASQDDSGSGVPITTAAAAPSAVASASADAAAEATRKAKERAAAKKAEAERAARAAAKKAAERRAAKARAAKARAARAAAKRAAERRAAQQRAERERAARERAERRSDNCTPGYSPCLPPASDYDCAGGSGNGPEYVDGPVEVTGSDPYDLDRDGDGIGCDR